MNMLHQFQQKPRELIDNSYIRVSEKVKETKLEDLEKNQIIELIKLAQPIDNCRVTEVKKKAIRDGLSLEKWMDTDRATDRMNVQFRVLELNTSAESVQWMIKIDHDTVSGYHTAMIDPRVDMGVRNRIQKRHIFAVEVSTHTKAIVRPKTRSAGSVAELDTSKRNVTQNRK